MSGGHQCQSEAYAVVGVLGDDTDPMVTVMKLEKAPQEKYADIGGLDQQIQEIKESVELPLTHPGRHYTSLVFFVCRNIWLLADI